MMMMMTICLVTASRIEGSKDQLRRIHFVGVNMSAIEAAAAAGRLMTVTVPAGCAPGTTLTIASPEGTRFNVQVPAGYTAGTAFQVQLPPEPAPPVLAAPTVLHTTAVEIGGAAPADAGGVPRLSAEHVTLVGGGGIGPMHVAPGNVTLVGGGGGAPPPAYAPGSVLAGGAPPPAYNPYASVVVPSSVVGGGGAPPPPAYAPSAPDGGGGAGPIPDINEDRYLWFSYWDKDGGGTLDMNEVR